MQATAAQAVTQAATQAAQTPAQHELYVHAIESLIALVVAFFVWRLMYAAIDRFFARRLLLRHPRAANYIAPIRSLSGVVILIALLLVLLNIWSVNTSPALWSAGVVTAALAFGAQSVVRDLLAGYSIFAENQFEVGDKVQLTTGVNSLIYGTVEAITLRATRLIDNHGRTVFIPNGNIYAATNFSKGHERFDLSIALPLVASIAAMRGELEKTARIVASEAKLDSPDVTVTLDDAGAQQATFGVTVQAPHVRAALSEGAMRERIVEAFQTKGWLPGGAVGSQSTGQTGSA